VLGSDPAYNHYMELTQDAVEYRAEPARRAA